MTIVTLELFKTFGTRSIDAFLTIPDDFLIWHLNLNEAKLAQVPRNPNYHTITIFSSVTIYQNRYNVSNASEKQSTYQIFSLKNLVMMKITKNYQKNLNLLIFAGHATALSNIYSDTNDEIENMMHQVVSVSKILFPMFIFPIMAQSYIEYYAMDMGEEAFKLTFQSL